MDFTLKISGLVAYAIHDDTIDALLLASREVGGSHGHAGHGADAHVPALVIPLEAVRQRSATDAPDVVFDAGAGQYGVWYLTGAVVHVRPDGKAPSGHVVFRTDGGGQTPSGNDDSLFWLPSIRKAAEVECDFRADCLPPGANPALVSAAVRVLDGRVAAMWATGEAKTQVFDFELPTGSQLPMKEYKQALADGIAWTQPSTTFIEILLVCDDGRPTRRIILKSEGAGELVANVCNHANSVGGGSIFDPSPRVTHFGLFYDLVEPPPSSDARRLPTAVPLTTRTNRCPGSSA
jgi:hypothetical protein